MVDPEVGPLARSTSARLITSLTGHPVFFDSSQRERFEVNGGLAAEAAADFRRHDLDVADRHAEHVGGHRAHFEGRLGGAIDGGVAVGLP